MPRERTDWVLRIGAATAVVAILFIILGCMSLTIGGRTEVVQHEENDGGVLTQTGEAIIAGDSELDVYYPIPYPNIPNLVLTHYKLLNEPRLVAQKEDHFRVRNPDGSALNLKWTAKGMKPPTPVLVAPVNPPPPPPPPELPPPAPIPSGMSKGDE